MSGNVKAVWVQTTVDSSYINSKCQDLRHGECGEFLANDRTVLKSLEIQAPSAEWQLAVETHLGRVREFASGSIKGSPLTVNTVSTEVCAEVDNREKWWDLFKDKECQLLTEGNVVPEAATVATLFR